ncbi:MAG: DUF3024 domain-containing protein [Deltaproteobacteria bacterium]|jgi:hypothetical protein|nr:DUF3024 domain-containing protein [Deltaproteobacteria bacterium]MBT4267172.1 DUF3024 domain-containing protein [Deltaproteobacteria bacterium]MBT4642072.1 DUF3024 domain-containing protein [Deltaproteobacteria bacterium]MBT6615855.1 DUF3024 domain-containing protein [Deltaproteobacteria bacterium]MBT7152976.1 DUF3024 domain-containing protein [Deltaproteobacteria bacterium]
MALSDSEKQRVEELLREFCQNRIPPHVRAQIKLFHTIRGNDVKIFESRPHWQNREKWTEMPIARLKYDPKSLSWGLYWPRANGKWEKYPDFKSTNNLKKIIEEIDTDPNHVFWG